MTAVGGFIAPRSIDDLESRCAAIIRSLHPYGRNPPVVESVAGAALGVSLFDLLPEDSAARQPIVSNERFLIVADVRLDNRESIAARVGSRKPLPNLSDADLLLEAWTQDHDGCLDRLVGDFAIAAFDRHERTLTLARDGAGQRPLFFARAADAVAFASMPSGLLSLREFNRGWDLERMGSLLNLIGRDRAETYFAGISRVRPGEVVKFSKGVQSKRVYWNPLGTAPPPMSFREAAERYRQVLDVAVRSRLRRRSGLAAVHLSSGYDSSAIAPIAALAARPQKILAYTAAPSPQFDGDVPDFRVGDESRVAALTAARHGLRHRIVHSSDFTLDYLRRQARLYQEPLRNIINALWVDEIRKLAAKDGASVLLNGMAGNMTLNAGGAYYLSEWLRQRGLRQWWQQAKAAARRDDLRWRGILFTSIAPWIPTTVWWSIWRTLRPHQAVYRAFLRKEWREAAEKEHDRAVDQANRSTAIDRLEFVRNADPAIFYKGALAETGVWELEPLGDRRVVEFSIALSPEQLIHDGEYRPVARAALRDLVPPEVLDARRGLQAVDWALHFTPQASHDILDEIATSETACTLLDVEGMRAAIENWPAPGDTAWHRDNTYTSQLPLALNTGIFLKETEEGWRRPV